MWPTTRCGLLSAWGPGGSTKSVLRPLVQSQALRGRARQSGNLSAAPPAAAGLDCWCVATEVPWQQMVVSLAPATWRWLDFSGMPAWLPWRRALGGPSPSSWRRRAQRSPWASGCRPSTSLRPTTGAASLTSPASSPSAQQQPRGDSEYLRCWPGVGGTFHALPSPHPQLHTHTHSCPSRPPPLSPAAAACWSSPTSTPWMRCLTPLRTCLRM